MSRHLVASDSDRYSEIKIGILRQVTALGLEEADYLGEGARLTEKFGTAPSPGDIYWGLANATIERLAKNPTRNAHQLQQTYWAMGLHLSDEGRSRGRVQSMQAESNKWALRNYQAEFRDMHETAAEARVEVSASSCCDACRRIDGQERAIKDAIEEMALPQPDCERDWCNCMWSMVLEEDLDETPPAATNPAPRTSDLTEALARQSPTASTPRRRTLKDLFRRSPR